MLAFVLAVVLLMQFAQSNQPISHRVKRPGKVQTAASRHLVEVHWKPVDGATSYEVFRADSPNGHYGQLAPYVLAPVLRRFFESTLPPDFLISVPQPGFADGTVKPGVTYYYRVRAQDGSHPGEFSDPAAGQSNEPDPGLVAFQINSADLSGPKLRNNWSNGVGVDHLGYVFKGDASPQVKDAGAQYRAANKFLHDSLGMRYIRAHGILSEGVVCRQDGTYDFRRADAIYDKVAADGMMPFVELSFMPECLAATPQQTIMSYSGVISPPKDYKAWGEFVRQFVAHLAERYGNGQVRQWYFEVWNEPDLGILWLKKFWKGSSEEYFRLYDYAATAVKSVDPAFRVGGPVGIFSNIADPFLKHVTSENFATGGTSAPFDFFDMHVYFSSPADWRPILKRYGLEKTPVIFSEWGASAANDSEVNDGPYGAAWSVGSVMSSSDSLEMMLHFAGTDYFEEAGAPQSFFHGGYGLLGLDQIRKPSYWAFYLLNEMQGTRLKAGPAGGGPASALVNVMATRNGGDISILMASVVSTQSLSQGVPELARRVFLNVEGLDSGETYSAKIERIDKDHSNVRGAWLAMGSPVWPNPDQLKSLHQKDGLFSDEWPQPIVASASGQASVEIELPMPGVARIALTPRSERRTLMHREFPRLRRGRRDLGAAARVRADERARQLSAKRAADATRKNKQKRAGRVRSAAQDHKGKVLS
jgi:xylan 1,4-beta-xylosidase